MIKPYHRSTKLTITHQPYQPSTITCGVVCTSIFVLESVRCTTSGHGDGSSEPRYSSTSCQEEAPRGGATVGHRQRVVGVSEVDWFLVIFITYLLPLVVPCITPGAIRISVDQSMLSHQSQSWFTNHPNAPGVSVGAQVAPNAV